MVKYDVRISHVTRKCNDDIASQSVTLALKNVQSVSALRQSDFQRRQYEVAQSPKTHT